MVLRALIAMIKDYTRWCRYIAELRKLILEERLMGTLLKKLTTLVKEGIIRAGSLPLEDTNQEEKVINELDSHKVVLTRNKTLLQNPNYGSRRKDEKNQEISR